MRCKPVKKILALQCTEYQAVFAPYHDNGLFANILQVCDALLLTKAGRLTRVPVLVDWRRKGLEGHFQYGPEGFDLWDHLFQATERCSPSARNEAPSGVPGRGGWGDFATVDEWQSPTSKLHFTVAISAMLAFAAVKGSSDLLEVCEKMELTMRCTATPVYKRMRRMLCSTPFAWRNARI
eukprot:Skav228310  [mRNA]  locus=scaffold4453:46197:51698:+ [translate_table: standard]